MNLMMIPRSRSLGFVSTCLGPCLGLSRFNAYTNFLPPTRTTLSFSEYPVRGRDSQLINRGPLFFHRRSEASKILGSWKAQTRWGIRASAAIYRLNFRNMGQSRGKSNWKVSIIIGLNLKGSALCKSG
ncbi:Uncharacterized protein Rs2_16880 [Raphanus sativus]|nr:Uncharacterized protein Rs2_16880 [Raphanus sativus]